MKKILISAILSLICVNAQANEIEISEPRLWEGLYFGDFSLSHKMLLCRPTNNTNDAIMSQFMAAYLFYRMDDMEGVEAILKGVDSYVSTHYQVNP